MERVKVRVTLRIKGEGKEQREGRGQGEGTGQGEGRGWDQQRPLKECCHNTGGRASNLPSLVPRQGPPPARPTKDSRLCAHRPQSASFVRAVNIRFLRYIYDFD